MVTENWVPGKFMYAPGIDYDFHDPYTVVPRKISAFNERSSEIGNPAHAPDNKRKARYI